MGTRNDRPALGRSLAMLAAALLVGVVSGAASSAPAAGAPGAEGLDVRRAHGLPSLIGTAPRGPVFSPDGRRLAFLWNDSGWPFRDIWIVDAAGGAPTRITDMSSSHPAPRGSSDDPVESLVLRQAARQRSGVSTMTWTPAGDALVFAYRGDLFRVAADGSALERLTDDGGGKSSLAYSPDGRFLSFLQGGDLWLWHLDEDALTRATDVGEPPINEVPVGSFHDRDVEFSDYAWAPDSDAIALRYVDRTDLRKVPFPSYISHDEPILNHARRAYPGDRGPFRAVAIYDVSDGRVRFVDLPDPEGRNVLDYAWAPEGGRLMLQQDSDEGEHRWISLADRHGDVRELLHDRRERRIYPAFEAVWSADGESIVFVSDHEDWYRLYSIAAGGGEPVALTPPGFDVASSRGAPTLEVAPDGRVFFQSTQASPYERQVYRVPAGGGEITRVTTLDGIHDFVLSPDGGRMATLRSNDVTPTELYLLDPDDGRERRVTHSPPPEFAEHDWVRPEYVTFESRIDDFTLHARILAPPDMKPDKVYPVVFGPVYNNTVRNQWTSSRETHAQMEALAGKYVNVQVDLRGSIGHGVDFREAFQGDWGGGDLEDLHSTVDYLRTLPYVDMDRIGIWGSSYGGMMVLFALFEKPEIFHVGVSGAPAIDPAHFTTFDQHLSRRPHTHPEIFRDSNLLNYGEGLEGELLFIQGMLDDIVPFQTTVQLMEKLMLLGKDFDLAVAPRAPHGWSGSEHYAVFMFRKLQRHFDTHLGPGPREPGDTSPR